MGKAAIVIIDDDPNARKTLADILKVKGYEPLTAQDGAEGLALLREREPQAILIDLGLPDMSGLDVLKTVRSEYPATEAIIVTGNATLDSAIEATNKGAFYYIQKPYETEQLLVTVKRAIEKRELADKVRQYQEHLEDLVSERTREIEEARLLAEAANRTKSEFLANMSHELTTPLNSVLGFSQVLLDQLYGPLNERQKEYAENILDSGRRLLRLITDVLELTKLESGVKELRTNACLVKDALTSAISMFAEESMRKNITLGLDLELEQDLVIEADVGKLQHILFNLLSNAVKFTPHGGSVRVSARRSHGKNDKRNEPSAKNYEPDADFIEISVADTGIGIRPEDTHLIFQDFKQLESPYIKRYSGAGLGLALTKKLVDLHGGRIWCESEFGKGSRFTFMMPAAQKRETEKAGR